jgi:dihydrofolate reductase
MPKLKVHSYSISLDGYGAGPKQSVDNPLGERGEELHEWVFKTRFWGEMQGQEGGVEGVDNDFLERGFVNIGAWIMGRNMFGPIRGPWGDEDWKGWWGDNPPYHCPVFVLTHHPRPSITMEGGTTFHFVDDDVETVRKRALDAADGADVRIGGGPDTIQQFLRAGLVDEVHVAIAPVLLGGGERFFDHIEGVADAYECVEFVASPAAAHVRFARKAS